MLGGTYLCFEGYEKVHGMFHKHTPHTEEQAETITPEALEKLRIGSAVRTDMILSAEIMAITYATVADRDLAHQIIVLAAIAVGITVAVYGFVGLIVKVDDIGVYFAKNGRSRPVRAFGRGLVKAMPGFLKTLGIIGTAAMLWVGAEIIAHGVPMLHHGLEHLGHAFATSPVLAWAMKAGVCALGGLVLGAAVAQGVALVTRLRPAKH